jgi:hypothetical protein
MSRSTPVMLQHDIVDQVLSYFAWNAVNPLEIPLRADRDTVVTVPPPGEVYWLSAAALVCKAWVEPALRHLCRTICVYGVRVPRTVLERMGHRIRSLCLVIDGGSEFLEPDIPFNCLTRLTTLVIRNWLLPSDSLRLLRYIHLSGPSTLHLANLVLVNPDWPTVAKILPTCKNLRRLRISRGHFDDVSATIDLSGPEKLDEFVIDHGHLGRALAPLFAAPLVNLNIYQPLAGPNSDMDHRVLCQAIKASSGTLRAVSLCCYRFDSFYPEGDNRTPKAQRDLAQALSSCTSLRFLQFEYSVFSFMTVPDLIALLVPLPIEFLSIRDSYNHHWRSEWLDSLHLLPNLLVIVIKDDNIGPRNPKLAHLVVEDYGSVCWWDLWPLSFSVLSHEARALFQNRPYREPIYKVRSFSDACRADFRSVLH